MVTGMANVYDLPAVLTWFPTCANALEDTVQRLSVIVYFLFGSFTK